MPCKANVRTSSATSCLIAAAIAAPSRIFGMVLPEIHGTALNPLRINHPKTQKRSYAPPLLQPQTFRNAIRIISRSSFLAYLQGVDAAPSQPANQAAEEDGAAAIQIHPSLLDD